MSIDPLYLFLEQSSSRPDHPAVVNEDKIVSYGQLKDMVERIASVISHEGAHPKVLIHLPQCAEAYASMFGTLMAGGYYAPTNIFSPLERQQLVINSFKPDIVITDKNLFKGTETSFSDLPVVFVDDLPESRIKNPLPAHDLAYVMFTSGSTGVPKAAD